MTETVERLEPLATDLPTLQPDPASAAEPFPLSPTQQALWIGRGDAVEFGNIGCYGYFEWERPELDLDRYRTAWQRVVDRHAALRTIVRSDGVQLVLADPGPVPLTVTDLRADPDPERRLAQLRDELGHQRLAPSAWPMFDIRVTLLPDRVRLHLGIDLQLMDAGSLFQNFFPDLIRLYEDPSVVLPPVGLTFRDFACWAAHELPGTDRYRRDRDYWYGRIDELPAAPELPQAPGQRAAADSAPRFERCSAELDPATFGRLRERARQLSITDNALLTAAFAEVLRGWSKNRNFTLNVPVFDRPPVHSDIEQVVGDFTNAIMLEARDDGPTFADRARGLDARLRADRAHGTLNGVEVLRELTRRRGAAAASMTIVVTSLLELDQPRQVTELGREVHSISQTPQVSLDFQIRELDGRLRLIWDYLADTFAPGVIPAAFEAYRRLLERLVEDEPGTGTWAAAWLDVRSEAERALRREVNDTATELADALLHEQFFAQAERTPDAEAVVSAERRLSYAELAEYARRIGHRLRADGTEPGELVAVVMEKGWEQYAAVYGVLAAGAAYLPIDASVPANRLTRLLTSGKVRTLLTQSRLAGRLAVPAGTTVHAVDRDFSAGDGGPIASRQSSTDLAYVIFTSGSTGDPKGVMVDHRGVHNLITDVRKRFSISPSDRLLAISGLHFDASIYDVFGPLTAGATVVLPEPFERAEPDRWADLVRAERVTIWNSVPVLMELLVGQAELRDDQPLATLRLAVLSGDWIPLTLPDRMRAQSPQLRVVGSGGPTETICWSLFYPIGTVDPAWTSIPYGKPLANQRYYIVDDNHQERPIWAVGEMAVASPVGLAHGYWDDPERTAAKFIRLPATGERAYLTGDLGRYLPDGNIEILGREDFQVKISGYRIELGEIEAVLNRRADIRTAVVVASRSAGGVRRLHAFVVPERPAGVVAAALRDELAGELPGYMVPSAISVLTELPLTGNGKVDRLRLTELASHHEPEAAGAEPDGEPAGRSERLEPLTAVIAACVAEVLGLDQVGPADNFFRLGGDSLSGTRLAGRLREVLGVDVPIRTVFEHPDLVELAGWLADDPVSGPTALSVADLLLELEDDPEPGPGGPAREGEAKP